MTFIDKIRGMNLETSKGERFNENDLLYINALHSAIKNIEQRHLIIGLDIYIYAPIPDDSILERLEKNSNY